MFHADLEYTQTCKSCLCKSFQICVNFFILPAKWVACLHILGVLLVPYVKSYYQVQIFCIFYQLSTAAHWQSISKLHSGFLSCYFPEDFRNISFYFPRSLPKNNPIQILKLISDFYSVIQNKDMILTLISSYLRVLLFLS